MSQSLRKFAADYGLRAGAGVCLLLLGAWMVATHPLPTASMLGGQVLLLIFACALGWWACSKTTATPVEIKTDPSGPALDVTHTSKRTESTALERLRVAI